MLPHEHEGWVDEAALRKPKASAGEIAAVLEKRALITRDHLAEIAGRMAQEDLKILVAACEALLDKVEA